MDKNTIKQRVRANFILANLILSKLPIVKLMNNSKKDLGETLGLFLSFQYLISEKKKIKIVKL